MRVAVGEEDGAHCTAREPQREQDDQPASCNVRSVRLSRSMLLTCGLWTCCVTLSRQVISTSEIVLLVVLFTLWCAAILSAPPPPLPLFSHPPAPFSLPSPSLPIPAFLALLCPFLRGAL